MTKNQEYLQSLVHRSRELLDHEGEFFTEGAKLALTDMVESAVCVLEGKGQLPFTRNRQFYAPREEEDVLFATKRYTRAPSYNGEQGYHEYGLEAALACFEQQDVRNWDADQLTGHAGMIIAKAEELLASAVIGKEVGHVDAAAKDNLLKAIDRLSSAASRKDDPQGMSELALAVVNGFNCLRDFRHSRILRTEIDPASNLYVTQEAMKRIQSNIARSPVLQELASRVKSISDRYSLSYIEKASALIMKEHADYEEINRHFYVWSSTDKIVNFTVPEQAVSAELHFLLPSEENEQDGLGHVWIDNVEISSAQGESLDIRNSGFERGDKGPLYWKPEARKGCPILKWEGTYPYSGGGERTDVSIDSKMNMRSIYICNPTCHDEGAWTYTEDLSVEAGGRYTLTFAAKLDGKLRKGLQAELVFKNAVGMEVDRFIYSFNRKSSLPNFCFLLTMQCDSIQYAFTGDITYAQKAKHQLLYTLNDFCQGAEHWLVTNLRPQGSDSYGAVQGGRMLCSAATTYSLIKCAGVFSPEEKQQFYALVQYVLRYMLDLRDRTELLPEEAEHGCSNWQTDMCVGTAYMMLVLDDFPHRKAWLYNAHRVLEAQLKLNVNPDHSWPESIRYHHAALERFAGYAKVVQHMMGEDWFSTTPLAGMFEFAVQTQTPAYRYFDNRIATPPFGDHALGDGSEFAYFSTYLADIARLDKPLADRMYLTWRCAGSPVQRLWGEAIVFNNFLSIADEYEPREQLMLESTDKLKQSGIYIFRKGFGTEKQSYFSIMSSPEKIGHGHLDQGSFILYKDSVPLVMDSGIEGYFNSSTSWHLSSYSHACLQFSTKRQVVEKDGGGMINLTAGTYSLERGWVDGPSSSRVLHTSVGGELESITIEIVNPESSGRHIRRVWYLRQPDVYVIQDQVEEFQGEVLFSLPVASKRSIIDGKRIYSEGVYDVDLETIFLGDVKRIWLEKGRSTPFFDSGHPEVSMMDYIRATADAEHGFLTVLYPKRREQAPIHAVLQGQSLSIAVDGDSYTILILDNNLKEA
ncbi:heparinase II/III domain-containing protein [Paenibacillus puerhi]|uniref:heparinase II/III domain-containing protein n=1 Tax=Paenibacillus puerhi TaxID=2692622 RepID=UPI001F22DBA2|nr:heparinase II/III family protein [Paenibacillus puerhi]